jgi:hypothetical protein
MKHKNTDLFKTTWEELTLKEFLQMVEVGEALTKVDRSSDDFGYLLIHTLRTLRKNHSVVAKLIEGQVVDCFEDITFFRRDDKGNFRTPWFFFPVGDFQVNGREFIRPDLISGLPMYNRSFDQLVFADAAFTNFCALNYEHARTPNANLAALMDECINGLIAILYTDPVAFNRATIDDDAKLVPLKLDPGIRSLILHTYANVRGFIIQRYPSLFPKPKEDDDAGHLAPVRTGPMWEQLEMDLADTPAFAGYKTACTALIHDALSYLDKKAERNAKV